MKRLNVFILALLVLLPSAAVRAYHLDISYSGDMSFNSTALSFNLSGSVNAASSTTVEPIPTDDGSGGVNVSWSINSDGFVSNSQSGNIIFAILSDYGDTAPSLVNVDISGYGGWDDNENICYFVCASDGFWAYIANDYGGSEPNHDTNISETLSLLTNTLYTVNGEAFAVANTYAQQGFPEHFSSWDDFADFYVAEQQNFSGQAYGESSVNYSLNITSVEEPQSVPEPQVIWLLGAGLIGLIGLARRKT